MSGRLLSALALAAACLLTPALAQADTFVYQRLYTAADGVTLTAVDDYGDYVIRDANLLCLNGPCYVAHIGGQSYYYLDAPPTLPADPNPAPAPGPGCIALPAGFVGSTCNNGYEFLFAYVSPYGHVTSIFAPSDLINPLGVVDIDSGSRFTDNGSFYFIDRPENTLGRVLDVTTTTTAAATPEPSSIALLATGLLGIAGTLKRRYA